MNNLQKLMNDYKNQSFSAYELIVIEECIEEIKNKGFAINCIESIANYFEKFGFVRKNYNNVFYRLKMPNE